VDITVTHVPDTRRFEIRQDGHVAELTYQRVGEKIIFTHTGVPSALEGQGVGGALARAGLEYARAEKLVVRPLCPFVAAYIARHPEYADLVR
jgi:predicted GNAT family acetyltransferase